MKTQKSYAHQMAVVLALLVVVGALCLPLQAQRPLRRTDRFVVRRPNRARLRKPELEILDKRIDLATTKTLNTGVRLIIQDPTLVVVKPKDPAMAHLELAVEGLELAQREYELASAEPNSLSMKAANLRLEMAQLEVEIRRQMLGLDGLEQANRPKAEQVIHELYTKQFELVRKMLDLRKDTWTQLHDLGLGPRTMIMAMTVSRIEIPIFWPVPKPSSLYVLPSHYIREDPAQTMYLRDVDERLREALEKCGYYERSYFAMPEGGFAMVTRLEQTDRDGTPRDLPDRWAAKIQPLSPGRISFIKYLKAMFTANSGYYRIIVFVATHLPLEKEDVIVSRDEAMSWLGEGLNVLPDQIGQLKYTDKYHCTALVYEFYQPNPGELVDPRVPGRLSARRHLEMADILNILEP